MKSKLKKQIIAIMLCMVMIVSGSISTLAEADLSAEAETGVETESSEAVEQPELLLQQSEAEQEAQIATASEEAVEEQVAPAAEEVQNVEESSDNVIAEEPAAEVNSEPVVTEEPAAEEPSEPTTVTEEVPQTEAPVLEMKYEDDDIKACVSAEQDGIIPRDTTLKVVPILAEDKETKDQYKEVEKKILEKAETEEYDIAGFLAYDISFVDADGNKVEPNGEVKVSLEYKNAVAPDQSDDEVLKSSDVTIMHLEEDENGKVKEVVDLSKVVEDGKTEAEAENKIETMKVDTANAVEKTEFTTKSFSAFVITWTKKDEKSLDDTEENKTSNDNRSGMNIQTYGINPASTDEGSAAVENLAHRKYIEKKGDGTYDLSLDVKGNIGTVENPAKVDIVVVFDISTSMKDNKISNKTYFSYAQEAVNSLINAISSKDNITERWNLISFGTTAQNPTGWLDSTTMKTKVKGLSVPDNNGTNYDDAFRKTATALSSADKAAKTIVVFLTDGVPTLHNTTDWLGHPTITGGSNYTTPDDYNAAMNSAAKITCDGFYPVGINLSNQKSGYSENNGTAWRPKWYELTGKDIVDRIFAKVTKKEGLVQDAQANDLTKMFNNIAGSIDYFRASNVNITDVLTPEVDPVKNAQPRVSILDAEGKDVTESESQAGSITPVYDSTTKTLGLSFAPGYELKKDYTYTVTMNIKPNEKATQLYVDNNYEYPHRGEEDTGLSSEGKEGIFTNVENSAKVSWKTNGEGDTKEAEYNRPVVQLEVEPKEPDSDNNILVSKTFSGLSWKQIQQLKKSFALSVYDAEGNKKATLSLNDSGVEVNPIVESGKEDEIKDYVFTWRVEGVGVGSYKVEETGQELAGYSVKTEGTGKSVTIDPGQWQLDGTGVSTITTNNTTTFQFKEHQMILTTLKGSAGYLIWTYERLSSAQQQAVIKSLNEDEQFKVFKTITATTDNCHFHYGDQIKTGISYGGATIQYGEDGNLTFGGKNAWQHIATGEYGWTGNKQADMNVTNTYEEMTISLDLRKVSTSNDGLKLEGAIFSLYKDNELLKDNITVNDNIELETLTSGVYRLKETTAPSGYSLLADDIYFKVADGVVQLCTADGTELSSPPNMWSLTTEKDSNEKELNVLTIKNTPVYDLPSAGGLGIYWYTIGGMLLMIAAALILYKNKGREVLNK